MIQNKRSRDVHVVARRRQQIGQHAMRQGVDGNQCHGFGHHRDGIDGIPQINPKKNKNKKTARAKLAKPQKKLESDSQ